MCLTFFFTIGLYGSIEAPIFIFYQDGFTEPVNQFHKRNLKRIISYDQIIRISKKEDLRYEILVIDDNNEEYVYEFRKGYEEQLTTVWELLLSKVKKDCMIEEKVIIDEEDS